MSLLERKDCLLKRKLKKKKLKSSRSKKDQPRGKHQKDPKRRRFEHERTVKVVKTLNDANLETDLSGVTVKTLVEPEKVSDLSGSNSENLSGVTTDCVSIPQEGNHHHYQEGRDMADPPIREVGSGAKHLMNKL